LRHPLLSRARQPYLAIKPSSPSWQGSHCRSDHPTSPDDSRARSAVLKSSKRAPTAAKFGFENLDDAPVQ